MWRVWWCMSWWGVAALHHDPVLVVAQEEVLASLVEELALDTLAPVDAVAEAATKNCGTVLRSHVFSHSVPLVPVDAAFALLELDCVRRQVPVHDGVAVGVVVQPLMADGREREDEAPEGGVEGLAHLPLARTRPAVVTLLGAEPHGEVVTRAAVLIWKPCTPRSTRGSDGSCRNCADSAGAGSGWPRCRRPPPPTAESARHGLNVRHDPNAQRGLDARRDLGGEKGSTSIGRRTMLRWLKRAGEWVLTLVRHIRSETADKQA